MAHFQRPALKTQKPNQAPSKPPSGLPPVVSKPETSSEITAATAAVEQFETQRRVFLEMREDWEKNFPEASQALQEILQQEDAVKEALAAAKASVALAKKTIGEFIASRRFSKPHYDEEEIIRILSSLKDRASVVDEMLGSGIVDAITLKRDAAIAWFAQRPVYSEQFKSAFRDKAELTCAVTIPKL